MAPAPPTDVTVEGYDRGNLITWTPPTALDGGTITGYKIYAGDSLNPTVLLKTVGPSKSTCEFPISNRKTRFYRVKTVTNLAESTYSANAYGISGCHAPEGFARKHLPETVTIYPRESVTGAGKPVFGDGFDAYVRIQYSAKESRDARGELILSKCQIQMDGSVPSEIDGAVDIGDGEVIPIIEIREYKVNGSVWMKEIYT